MPCVGEPSTKYRAPISLLLQSLAENCSPASQSPCQSGGRS